MSFDPEGIREALTKLSNASTPEQAHAAKCQALTRGQCYALTISDKDDRGAYVLWLEDQIRQAESRSA